MFYDSFMKICEEVGIAPSRLLIEIGVGKSGANNWKNGTEPTNRTKKLIADYLGITVQELVNGEIEKPAAPKGDELKGIDAELYNLLRGLTPEQAVKVRAFIAGMKA